MGQTISFDYFYGGQSDAFSYYRIPRLLITGQQFKGLSTDAKLLYGLLLDRMGLSSRKSWAACIFTIRWTRYKPT